MFRLYTEDVNRPGILRILDADFSGYTIIPTLGRWQGKDEASLCVEVDGATQAQMVHAAEEIKAENHQESVMLTDDPEEKSTFI